MSVIGGPALDNDVTLPPPPAPLRPGAIASETYDRLPPDMQRNYSQVRSDDGAPQYLSRFSLLNDPSARPADSGPRKASEAEFEAMNARERIDYARQFDQSQHLENGRRG